MATVRQRYEQLKQNDNQKALAQEFAYSGLTDQEIKDQESKGFQFYRGKVRDLLIKGDEIEIIHSDRLTAFDKFIDMVPYKGTILNAISAYWLDEAKKIMPTHLKSKKSSRSLQVEAMTPFKIEVIVRGYLAGSMARAYQDGERDFCGNKLPEGLKTNQQLPEIIITPTTKAAVFEHDENTTANELIEAGTCTAEEWQSISAMALKLFDMGTKVNEKLGWILVDTKYEFGQNASGEIKVIDEIHTPDSSRFWVNSSYADRLEQNKSPEMLDKEIVRRWLLSQGYKGEGEVPAVPMSVLLELGDVYLEVAEKLTGDEVECD